MVRSLCKTFVLLFQISAWWTRFRATTGCNIPFPWQCWCYLVFTAAWAFRWTIPKVVPSGRCNLSSDWGVSGACVIFPAGRTHLTTVQSQYPVILPGCFYHSMKPTFALLHFTLSQAPDWHSAHLWCWGPLGRSEDEYCCTVYERPSWLSQTDVPEEPTIKPIFSNHRDISKSHILASAFIKLESYF